MTRLSGDWLDAAQPVLAALAPHPAYVVGGAVRNALLGEPVADVDIATAAPPEEVTARVRAAGLQAVPTGIAHGTVTVVSRGQGYEVTTFRRDVETFGRHAVVAFSDSLTEDAARRDFTLNALYATPAGEVIDPLGGGIADCRARRVRFVGAPADRIREDTLRILRFFRFFAHYGQGAPDPAALAACRDLAAGIAGLSRERVGAEMRKLLTAPDPVPAVQAMAQAGVLAQVRVGADPTMLAWLVALGGAEPILRLAALGGTGDLRLSRAEARRISELDAAANGDAGPEELGYRLGAEPAQAAGRLRAARWAGPLPPGWDEAAEAGARAVFPVRAGDLALTGPALGARLKALETAWIASGFRLTREELLG